MAVAMAIVKELKEAVRELGLSESVAHLVWVLDPDADPLPLRQIADRLRGDPSHVTLLSERLADERPAPRRRGRPSRAGAARRLARAAAPRGWPRPTGSRCRRGRRWPADGPRRAGRRAAGTGSGR